MDWLNGKKTVLGSIMLALAVWLPQLGVEGDWIQYLAMLGTLFGGVGISHKAAKGDLSGK